VDKFRTSDGKHSKLMILIMGTSKCYMFMRALILAIMAISVAMNAAFIAALVIKDCGVGNKKNPFTDATDTDDHVLVELEDTVKALGTGVDPVLGSECETTLQEEETFDVGETSKLSQYHWGQTVGNAKNLILPYGQASTSKFHSTKKKLDMLCYRVVKGFANGETFAKFLDDFWGNLFDLHGKLTEKGKIISMCPEQGNWTLPAVVELRRVAKSTGMGSNSTSYWAPCPLEELNAMTFLVQKCPSQQVAQQAFKSNDRGGYDEKLVGLAAEMAIFGDIFPSGEFSPNVVVDSDVLLLGKQPVPLGEYSTVLNRLQGILETAFLDPVHPISICECTETASTGWPDGSPRISAVAMLRRLRQVEAYIFDPRRATVNDKGKEDMKSVLNRYKLWLNKVAFEEY
ncbi:hypothetical protein BAE44_0017507, partial [Dichanthelium oligosanthes]